MAQFLRQIFDMKNKWKTNSKVSCNLSQTCMQQLKNLKTPPNVALGKTDATSWLLLRVIFTERVISLKF